MAVAGRVHAVPFGHPATEALAACIAAAKQRHPLDPVTVIVPSNLAGLAARRVLGATGCGLANITFVTPLRMAELLAAGALPGRRPLTNPVLASVVRAALREEAGMVAPVASHRATHAAVMKAYSELSRALPETLDAIAAASSRGAEVVRLVRAIKARLAGFSEEDDVAAAATGVVRADPAGATQALGTVVWYLPDTMSPAMAALVAAVLGATSSAVVAGLTGDPDADLPTRRAAEAAGVTVPEAGITTPTASRLISVTDPDEEARAVIREVMRLAEAGTPLERIAVVYPTRDPYARTILEQLDAAGIPHNGPATTRLAGCAAGRTLLGALSLPDGGWGRAEVIGVLAGAPVRNGDRWVPSGRWDTVSRRAGVVAGLDDWQQKLATFAASRHAEHDRLSEDGTASEGQLAALAGDADAAGELASFITELAARIDSVVADDASWATRSRAARALLDALLGAEHRRTSWPEREREAAERVDAALVRLGALDELEASPTAAAFLAAVAAELAAPAGRVGRFGTGVHVTPLMAAVGLDLDAVFVVGVAEGSCPALGRDGALVPDADKERAVAGELVTRRDRLRQQHRAFLAALAAAPEANRVLVFPRGDLRGRRGRLPSRWLLDSARQLAGEPVFSSDVARLAPPVLDTVQSFHHGLAAATVPAAPDERDLASVLAFHDAGGDAAQHPACGPDAARGIGARRARASEDFTEWDGNLAGHTIPSPATGVPLSPTRLEKWADCPFAYFLGHVLGLDDRDDPERIVEIAATDRGTLVHHVLEAFVAEAIDRPGGPPAPHEPWTEADRLRLREIAEAAFAEYEAAGRTGRPLSWRRTREDILADLDLFLESDTAYRKDAQATPRAVELAFGIDGAPPLELSLLNGRSVSFRGKIDRVDDRAGGGLAVHDYKTGKADGYKDIAGVDPVLEGTALQLGVYAEAGIAATGRRPVHSDYWLITSRGGFARLGYEWTAERRTRFVEVADAIVEGIEHGVFPAQPGAYDSFWGTHDNCGFCPFDRVCPRDRDEHQKAKAGAKELEVLNRLQVLQPELEASDPPLDAAVGGDG